MRYVVSLLFFMLANSAAALAVSPCDLTTNYSLAERTEVMTRRSYANGTVSFFVVHDGRPRSSDSLFLVVYAPEADDPDKKQCQMISMEEGSGFANIALRAADASFSRADGLTVAVPTRIFSMEDGSSNSAVLSINVNQQTHEVSVTKE